MNYVSFIDNRAHGQDAILVMPERKIFGVFDGVSSVGWEAEKTKDRWVELLECGKTAEMTTRLLIGEAQEKLQECGINIHVTTLMIGEIRGQVLTITSLGDSEAFAWNKNGLRRLTVPQTAYHTRIEEKLLQEYPELREHFPGSAEVLRGVFKRNTPSQELRDRIHKCIDLKNNDLETLKALLPFIILNILRISPDSPTGLQIKREMEDNGWSMTFLSMLIVRLMNCPLALPSCPDAQEKLEITHHDISQDDGILLCTDGLTKILSKRALDQYFRRFKTISSISRMLEATAGANLETSDCADDVSVILIETPHEAVPDPTLQPSPVVT